jgi:D-glycero-D-manno-heptose 1,7-bisphosphate phosphatase
MTKRRYVVLDRDGTIIAERNYLSDPAEVELLPGAASGLSRLRRLGLGLIVVTNQSALGRGIIDLTRLDQIHKRLGELLEEKKVILDGLYVCPHLPEDGCSCRKPGTALLAQAARDLDFDPRRSFVIGDKECDISLGNRVGATTILVLTGYGELTRTEGRIRPDFIVDDLSAAAAIIEHLMAAD